MDVGGYDLFCFSTFLDITEKEKMALKVINLGLSSAWAAFFTIDLIL